MSSLLEDVLKQAALASPTSQWVVFPANMVPTRADTLLLPGCAAILSVIILLLHGPFRRAHFQKTDSTGSSSVKKNQPKAPLVKKLEALRLLLTLVLIALSVATQVQVGVNALERATFYSLLGAYAYSACLALASTLSVRPVEGIFRHHLTAILLAFWATYIYRDVWPLATYTLSPIDAIEGPTLWAKVTDLTLAAVLIPLITPRQPDTYDEEGNENVAASQDFASPLSVVTFSYLDEMIWKGYKMDTLPVDDMPQLARNDRTKRLVETKLRNIDPLVQKKPRHLFFGLLKAFGGSYTWISILLVLRIASVLAGPLGIYQLLNYLETRGEGAVVRPWVWVVWLFLGPVFSTMLLQTYSFIITRVVVHAQALLTQLIFNHALRTRVKAEVSTDSGTSPPGTSSTASKNSLGRLFNLATSDVNNILDGREFPQLICIPLQIILSMAALYYVLDWSAIAGLATMIALSPLPGYLTSFMHGIQASKMKKTDARVQEATEAISVIRMIKLFAWEARTSSRLDDSRAEELLKIRSLNITRMITRSANWFVPVITMGATFFTYTVVMKRELTASKVYFSMAVFNVIRQQLVFLFHTLPALIRAKVSLDRVTEFLHQAELLDEFTTPTQSVEDIDVLGIRAATFTWSAEASTESPATSSEDHTFRLRVDDELKFEQGRVNLIVGPTGSGKTALLLALLGELHYVPDGPESFVSLPRSKGVAYVAQESWIESDTIRANILFGEPYDEARYQQVLHQCGLEHDLGLFDHGDMTEVGERGLTLSGGQKARVSLARAVYSPAEILLIDDVFAALDVHTAKWIVEKCFKGDLMRDRTVLLVTHNIALVQSIASFAVSMSKDGKIAHHGKWSRVLVEDAELVKDLAEDEVHISRAEQNQPAPAEPKKSQPARGNLISEEEVSKGRVSWKAWKLYLSNMGSSHLFLFWTTVLSLRLLSQLTNVTQMYWLGWWAEQYEHSDQYAVSVAFYLGIYFALVVLDFSAQFSAYATYLLGTLRSSKYIHKTLVDSVLGATLRWLDRTPSSRIITRFTQDIQTIDGTLSDQVNAIIDFTMMMVSQLVGIILVAPLFSLLGLLTALLGGWTGQIYMKGQLPVQREQSNARQPILGHLGATMAGLTTIRAYGAQQGFIEGSFRRIDRYSRATLTFWDLNRWIGLRLDALANLFTACLAAYLVYGPGTKAAITGFALNMAAGFSGMVLWWIRMYNQLEVTANSLERVDQYLEIEHELRPTPAGAAPAYWPASGKLVVENLSARYSEDGPAVLQDVSFEIKSGERVGIVGRTGSGKSSLTLSLLRLIPTSGRVYYDGIPTDSINLDALRSKITIIPQMPELLSGTLRQNLDPFSEHPDATLNDALRTAGLFSLQPPSSSPSPSQSQTQAERITLDFAISSGGTNLSVGQRQILALARAVLRQSKLLILDEATSAIDYTTDTSIQRSLRSAIPKDVSVLTIAHRLHTVMDADKILVLDAGHIAEFGTPADLLRRPGLFSALVDESGDSAALRAMVAAA